MAEQLGSAVLTLSVDDKQFNAGLRNAQSAAQNAGAALRAAVGQLGLVTTAGGIAAFIGQQVVELDSASAAVRTLGVDAEALKSNLRNLSVELENNVSQVELTKAAYDVASSGFASAADATEILRASALGSKGGFADLNDVARALTGVLNAYGLTAGSATDIVDKFIQTQADGVITVRQYANEIGNVSSIAAAAGIPLEQLNAAIATATLRGVPVTQTFTGLRQAISSIIKPSEQASDLAASLGLQFNVAALQSKGLGGVLADVQQKTGGAADKIAILLGSVEAQTAIQPLLNDKLAKYNELLAKQAQAAGQAGAASEINSKTISGGLKQIGTGFSNLATTLDSTLTPLFGGFIKSLNEILLKLNQVAAFAPDKVRAREREAGNLVQAAIGPFGGSGFFGKVSVKYKGKTYSGSAAGVREAIVQAMLQEEIGKMNQAAAGTTGAAAAAKPPIVPAAITQPTGDELKAKAALQQQRVESDLILRSIGDRILAARELAGVEAGILRQTIQQRQEIEAGIQAAKGQVARLGAQIEGLRIQGTDKGPELERLVAEQRAAANEVQLKLIKGATELRDAGKTLRDDLNAGVLEPARVRNDPGGLNQYLNQQQIQQRGAETLQLLPPRFREAQARFSQLTGGAQAPEFRGTTANVIDAVQRFISQVSAEETARTNVVNIQQALAENTANLADVNRELAAAVNELNLKDWNVVVNVSSPLVPLPVS